MINRQTIGIQHLSSLCWLGNELVDIVQRGMVHLGKNAGKASGYYFGYSFDAAITSQNQTYSFIYQKRGTKGLLLKNGEILREINRSYYFADAYEYPAAFATLHNGLTYLIHCPVSYRQLDFEEVETGEITTNIPGRMPSDVFHSRLETSPNTIFLVSKGWVWHPWDVILAFDIEACLENPLLLDKNHFIPDFDPEITTANCISDTQLLIGACNEHPINEEADAGLRPGHITVWDLQKKSHSGFVKVACSFGQLFAINAAYAWDVYQYPKLINLQTGTVEMDFKDIITTEQRSSIFDYRINGTPPIITFNRNTGQLAIGYSSLIEILSFKKDN